MLGVLLVDAGLVVGFVAIVSLVRPLRFLGIATRRRALLVGGGGLLFIVTGMALPASLRRIAQPTSELDAVVPAWQFGEHHDVRIHATPERVEAAIHAVTADEIFLFRTLTWIRSPHLPGSRPKTSILAAPGAHPILESALSGGFITLAEVPRRELVLGSLVMVPDALRRLSGAELEGRRAGFTPARFAELSEPGYAKAAMNFLVEDEGDGWVRLSTETRVVATDDGTRRRFAAYWRIIYPGSSLIRRSWLAAIRRRAESVW